MEENKNLIDKERQNLLLFVWKNRKIVLYFSGASMLIATVVSFLMTPLYKSTAIVFPAATSTVSFSEQRNAKAAAMDFGEEEQAEQLVQILSSSQIRNKIVERYDLYKHYKIDPSDANRNFKLMKAYEEHFSYTRTRYGSIEISVLDADPKLAAEMANKIVDLIDTVKNAMVQERTLPAFEINKRKKELLELDREIVLKKLDSLGELGVLSLEGRTNLFTAYIDAKSAEDRKFLRAQIDINLKNGALFDGLEAIRDEKIIKLEKFLDSYEQAESDANTLFNHKFVVEHAVVADKKDKPKRLILILLSTIGGFMFIVFALLIKERIAELKKIA